VTQKGFQKRDAELESAKARLAESLAQNSSLAKALTETKGNHAELAQSIAALRKDFACQIESVYKEFQQRNADRDAVNKRLSEALTQNAALKQMLDDLRSGQIDLAHTAQALRQEFARQLESVQKETAARHAEWEGVVAKLTKAITQTAASKQALATAELERAELEKLTDGLRKEFAGQVDKVEQEIAARTAEWQTAVAGLSRIVEQLGASKQAPKTDALERFELDKLADTLRQDFARQIGSVQKEIADRAAEWEIAVSRLSETPPRSKSAKQTPPTSETDTTDLVKLTESLRKELTGQIEAVRKELEPAALTEAVAALHKDLARQEETFQRELRKRDADRALDEAALATVQAQTDALKQTVSNCESAVADAVASVHFATAMPESPGGDTAAKGRVDKNEALELHKAAREAYVKKDYAEALRLLDIIDTAFPSNKSVLYNRAECLAALGRKDEARDLCDYLIDTHRHAPAKELKKLIGN